MEAFCSLFGRGRIGDWGGGHEGEGSHSLSSLEQFWLWGRLGLATESEGPRPSVGVLGHLELFMTNMENISQMEEQS